MAPHTQAGLTAKPRERVGLDNAISFTVFTAYIGLGSNVGDREAMIARGAARLAALERSMMQRMSSVYETAPVGPVAQGAFLNAAVAVRTEFAPLALLAELLRIEREAGRDRVSSSRWGPRTLDLDLLLYGEQIVQTEGLTVPHPRLHERAFVLVPLAEIAPDVIVPGVGRSVRELRDAVFAAMSAQDRAGIRLHGPPPRNPPAHSELQP